MMCSINHFFWYWAILTVQSCLLVALGYIGVICKEMSPHEVIMRVAPEVKATCQVHKSLNAKSSFA